MRDFRDIGHKAIYVSNSWRTLRQIGWQHAEPVLRSLAYALVEHEGENPAHGDAPPDRPWKENQELAPKIRADWAVGKAEPQASAELLATLRSGSAAEASRASRRAAQQGCRRRSRFGKRLMDGAGELMMRDPNIRSLHAVTTTNAMHFAFGQTATDLSKRLLLLQNAAFIPLFRGNPKEKGTPIDQLEPLATKGEWCGGGRRNPGRHQPRSAHRCPQGAGLCTRPIRRRRN